MYVSIYVCMCVFIKVLMSLLTSIWRLRISPSLHLKDPKGTRLNLLVPQGVVSLEPLPLVDWASSRRFLLIP